MRTLEPFLDRSGACPLLLDVERSCLVEVPDEYRFHIASALETGDLDEDLVGWLAGEDLLTHELISAPKGRALPAGRQLVGDGFVRVQLYPHRIECFVSRLPLAEPANLEALFANPENPTERVFFIGCGQPVEDFFALESLITAVRQRAHGTVSFRVTTTAEAVTPPVAAQLARLGVRLTLRCDASEGIPSPTVQRSIDLLRSRLDHDPVVEVSLRPGQRLRDLWLWLRQAGTRRIGANWLDDRQFVTPWVHAEELRLYEQDVFEICDDIQRALEEGEDPVLYEPVARLIERLISAGPIGCWEGSVAWLHDGKVLPVQDSLPSREPLFAEAIEPWSDLEARRDEAGEDFRQVDLSAAVLLFHQLRKADPRTFLDFPLSEPRPADNRRETDDPHHSGAAFL
ncbi:MAG: hypothetical protein AAF604_00365 [Acidobacteriota bacterium]